MAGSRFLRTVAVLAVAAVTVAGCGSGSDDAADPAGSTVTRTETADPQASPAETADSGTSADQAAGSDGFSDGVDDLRDGAWQVGDAGEVEFTLADGTVSLVAVRPSEG